MDKLFNKTYTRKQLITAGLIASGSILALTLGKKYFNGGVCKVTRDLTGKVVVITGGNTGIGKEAARELAKLGATIIIGSRDPKKTLPVIDELRSDTMNPNIEFIQLDLSNLRSIEAFVTSFKAKYSRLDILINNAGIMAPQTRTVTKDGFEAQFGTNHLGHFYLTQLLLDIIKTSGPSRIINVTAGLYAKGNMNWDDLMYEKNYSPMISYYQSKLANVLFTRELQRRMDLEKANVKVVSLHPGVSRTEGARYVLENPVMKIITIAVAPFYYYFTKSPNQGAQTTLYCALEEQSQLRGGAYYADCEETPLASVGLEEEAAIKLWEVSQKLIQGAI